MNINGNELHEVNNINMIILMLIYYVIKSELRIWILFLQRNFVLFMNFMLC